MRVTAVNRLRTYVHALILHADSSSVKINNCMYRVSTIVVHSKNCFVSNKRSYDNNDLASTFGKKRLNYDNMPGQAFILYDIVCYS